MNLIKLLDTDISIHIVENLTLDSIVSLNLITKNMKDLIEDDRMSNIITYNIKIIFQQFCNKKIIQLVQGNNKIIEFIYRHKLIMSSFRNFRVQIFENINISKIVMAIKKTNMPYLFQNIFIITEKCCRSLKFIFGKMIDCDKEIQSFMKRYEILNHNQLNHNYDQLVLIVVLVMDDKYCIKRILKWYDKYDYQNHPFSFRFMKEYISKIYPEYNKLVESILHKHLKK